MSNLSAPLALTLFAGLFGVANVAAQSPSPSATPQAAARHDCLTPRGQAAVLAGFTIERPTNLTKDSLRAIIDAPQLTFIHWRWEGLGDNVSGDRYFCDVLQDFGPLLDRVLQVEGTEYRFKMLGIKQVLDEVNPRLAYTTKDWPNYSIVGNGIEARIERAPYADQYTEDYEAWLEPIGGYLEALARGEQPNQVRRSQR